MSIGEEMTPEERLELKQIRDFWLEPVRLSSIEEGGDLRSRADRLDDFLRYWTVPPKRGRRPRMERLDTLLELGTVGHLGGKILFSCIVGLATLMGAYIAIKEGGAALIAKFTGGGGGGAY